MPTHANHMTVYIWNFTQLFIKYTVLESLTYYDSLMNIYIFLLTNFIVAQVPCE